jgi:hypothetical protein
MYLPAVQHAGVAAVKDSKSVVRDLFSCFVNSEKKASRCVQAVFRSGAEKETFKRIFLLFCNIFV